MILAGGNMLNTIAMTNLFIKPDVFVVLLAFFALKGENIYAVLASFIIGICADIISLPMGASMITFLLIGFALNSASKLIVIKRMFSAAILIFVLCLAVNYLRSIIVMLATSQFNGQFFIKGLGISFYTAILGSFAWWGLNLASDALGFKTRR
jgi:rod shape-determining protein MreD